MHKVTERMEANTLRMIAKVFNGPDPLSRSTSLRRKALAHIDINLAFGYRDSHAYGVALARIARSLLLWPFPYPYEHKAHCHPLARLKFLACVVTQAASWHLGLDRSSHVVAGAAEPRIPGGEAGGVRGVTADVDR